MDAANDSPWPEDAAVAACTWHELLEAAAGGLIDETHWVELKREIPTTKNSNAELAKDLASLAPDGGVLIIGVDENDLGQAQSVVGTDLKDLAERIDAVARSRIDPALVVRSHPAIEDPHRSGYGCLLGGDSSQCSRPTHGR